MPTQTQPIPFSQTDKDFKEKITQKGHLGFQWCPQNEDLTHI